MKKTRRYARIALGAAAIVLSAWLTVPGPVPFTMQTMAVMTVAALLGPGQGCAAVAVYLLLGAVGVPVFSGFRAGIHMLLGATGGYLIGFLSTAWLTGWAARRWEDSWRLGLAMAGGIALCYAFGTAWYAVVYADSGIWEILLACVVPFLLPDAAKLVLSLLLVRRIRRSGALV